jgi:hypothetical protein
MTSKSQHHSPKCIIWSAITLLLTAHTVAVAAPNPAIHAACHEDAKRLCADVFGNLEAVRACMREHHEQLSDKCKTTISEVKHGKNSAHGKNPVLPSPAFAAQSCYDWCLQNRAGHGTNRPAYCLNSCVSACQQKSGKGK